MTAAIVSGVASRNGPPDAVRSRRRDAVPSPRRRGTARSPSAPNRSAGARRAGWRTGRRASRAATAAAQAARQRHDEVAAGDQRLLVGRRHDLAGPQRGEHRPQADDAARADDDEVDVVAGREPLERIVAADAFRAGRQVQAAQPRLVAERDGRAAGTGRPARRAGSRSSRSRARRRGRRPGAPPGRRPSGGRSSRSSRGGRPASVPAPLPGPGQRMRARTYRVTTGAAKTNESTRSSIPPWPGMSVPESFAPAARLMTDSARSPACAASAVSGPSSRAWSGFWPRPTRAGARPRRSSRRPRRRGPRSSWTARCGSGTCAGRCSCRRDRRRCRTTRPPGPAAGSSRARRRARAAARRRDRRRGLAEADDERQQRDVQRAEDRRHPRLRGRRAGRSW